MNYLLNDFYSLLRLRLASTEVMQSLRLVTIKSVSGYNDRRLSSSALSFGNTSAGDRALRLLNPLICRGQDIPRKNLPILVRPDLARPIE